MDHIFDNVGVDMRYANRAMIPISTSYGVFPSAVSQPAGLRLDSGLGDLYYSDVSNWVKVAKASSILWQDTRIAFGRTSTGGLDWDSRFSWYHPLGSLQINKGSTTPTVLSYTHNAAITAYMDGVTAATALQAMYAGNSPGIRSVAQFNRARGSLDNYQATAAEDYFGGIVWGGYDGSSFQNGVSIEAIQDGPTSGNYVPARLTFRVGGNTGTRVERFVIKANGWVGIGTTNPSVFFEVNGLTKITSIPYAPSSPNILVSSGGVISYATASDIGIPVVTPAALTKVDDTNVTLTLGGTPGTALLQNVSLTLGWNGVLAISRGGTGLGTLGTANQLLRVNSSATALEYFTPDWTSNTGTVTNFSAGNLSPLFTTNVATPTTTPALSFNLSNCNQYQVFGRVAAGTGAPSYVSLNPIAFNGLAIPSGELVYGTGTSVTSLNKYRVVAGEGIVSGDGIGVAYFGMYAGNGVNEGGALRIKRGSNFVTYIGSDCAAFGGNNDNTTIFAYGNNSVNIATNSVRRLIVDGNGYVTINNIPTASSSVNLLTTNGGVIETRTIASLGFLTTSTAATTYVPYIGATNDVDLGSNNFKIGNNIGTRNITLASGNSTGDASYIMFKRGG
jgi:hypothetical protein